MYYGSQNYGGALQAYALCRALKLMNIEAEQICYDGKFEHSVKGRLKRMLVSNLNNLELMIRVRINLKEERQAVSKWSLENTPHSTKVYTKKNIIDANKIYDCYIAGSDQIWSSAFSDVYLLSFADKEKKKISYAASLGNKFLTDEMKKRFHHFLSTFSAISVREESAVTLLQACTDNCVHWCLDPTLLLEKKDWDSVCSPRLCQEKYMFCYFLGNNNEARLLAKKYAKKQNLKIINLPYLLNKYRRADGDLGDENIYNATPGEFISYIRFADIIFTDSFHASVFSIIYDKRFVAFPRNVNDKTTGRLHSLTKIFECEDHFCDTNEKVSLEYIEEISVKKEYSRKYYRSMKNKSLSFLTVATK